MSRMGLSMITFALVGVSNLTGAQGLPPTRVGTSAGRLTVEGYISQNRFDGGTRDDRLLLEGVGGRVLWSLAPVQDALRGSFASRLSIGGFYTHAPATSTRLESRHFGIEADLRTFAGPLFNRVDPIVSLGIGAFRTETKALRTEMSPYGPTVWIADDPAGGLPAVRPLELIAPSRTTTRLAITPGVGARLFLTPGLALRGDVRDVVLLGPGRRHNVEIAGGMSVTL